MAKWVFLNGSFVGEENARLHFKDLSFQRGYGIFDFFRLVGNTPLFLNDHIDRFFFSADGMHLPVPLSRDEIRKIIFDMLERNNLPDTGVRLSLTGGYSEDGFNIGKPNFLVSQHSITPPTATQINNGIRLFSYPHQRPLPSVKSIDYLMAVWLQPKRTEASADDILYHQNGVISECPRSNFFLVTADEKIVTPAENALPGITRKKVLQLAREHFTVEERPVALAEIASAKEAFITSTTKQILPVSQIDEHSFSQNRISLQLLRLFRSAYVTG